MWFDRVYVCYENMGNSTTNYGAYGNPIQGFKCCRFGTTDLNYSTYDQCFVKLEAGKIRHAVIPMCRYLPEIFDKYVLHWKLKNMYWGGNISVSRKCNEFE